MESASFAAQREGTHQTETDMVRKVDVEACRGEKADKVADPDRTDWQRSAAIVYTGGGTH